LDGDKNKFNMSTSLLALWLTADAGSETGLQLSEQELDVGQNDWPTGQGTSGSVLAPDAGSRLFWQSFEQDPEGTQNFSPVVNVKTFLSLCH
jgi:hypothetical protein